METAALYQHSHLLSEQSNNKLNFFNFYSEAALTLSVFVSSLLVITLEKDWWTFETKPKDAKAQAVNMNDFFSGGAMQKGPDTAHVTINTTRDIILAISISFFVIVTFIEIV